MLDSRLYRAAFVPVVLAVVIAAFALGDRPRPIGTTLAPDAFDGRRAFATLNELGRTFPRTRPGSPGDEALAARVQADLRSAGFGVRTETTKAPTIDGDRSLTTVIAERPGLDSRRIVVIAHRDRAATGDVAPLSGTAALLELARLYSGRPTRRTLTFVSASGASGGLAGVRALPEQLGGPVHAALVLGDLASRVERRPYVIPWSEHGGMAPLRLRRTVEHAVSQESDVQPGSPRALVQLARLAVPLTLTAQGPLGGDGFSAVTLQVSGERGADPGEPGAEPSEARLQGFGRGVLRSISALDNGPSIASGPRRYVIFSGRVVPHWAVQVIAGLLLLPVLVASVDGLARVRRRRNAVAVWLRWLVAAALPFALAALVARLLGVAGLVPPVKGAIDPVALPVDAATLVVVGLTVVLGFVLLAPVARRLGSPPVPRAEEVPGAAAALGLALSALGLAVWAVNPYTALLIAPAVHLWLLAAAPEVRLPRPVLLLLVLLAFAPFMLVGVYYAQELALGPVEVAWQLVMALAGGSAGPLGVLVWSAILGCGAGAVLVALRKPRIAEGDRGEGPVSIRGPLRYAGPGSLGGTDSALRR